MGISIASSVCRSTPPPKPTGPQADTDWAKSRTSNTSRPRRLAVCGVTVETIATPHDAEDGVVFVVDDGKHRLAF